MNVILIFGSLYLRYFFPLASFKIFFFSSFYFLNFDSDMAKCSWFFFPPLLSTPCHLPIILLVFSVSWICGLVSVINLEKFLLFIAVNTVSFFFKKYLLIWLHQVLVVAHRIFPYSMRALCYLSFSFTKAFAMMSVRCGLS